jgi:excisionase family DNA binding protein
MNDGFEFLSVREAARRLSLSTSGVRLLIRQGRLPARRLRGGRAIRIAVDALDRLLEPVEPRQPAQIDLAARR